MKHFYFLPVAACVLFASGVAGAQAASTAVSATKQPRVPVRQVLPPPASVVAHGQARHSTAQTEAAKGNKPPLQELPAFTGIDLDGHAITTKQMVRKGHWLLVYQRQHCAPCDAVLKALAASESPLMKRGAPYVIVVAVPNASALAAVRADYPTLSEAMWVADSNKEAVAALKPKSAPMLYALHRDQISFSVPGTLGDPANVEKLASSWLVRKDHQEEDALPASLPAVTSTAAPAK